MSIWLLLISMAVVGISGIPGVLLGRRTSAGQWIAVVLNVIGSGMGGVAILLHYVYPGDSDQVRLRWALPLGGFAVAIDDLSALFLIPIFLISAIGAVYGLGYWRQRRHPGNGQKL